MKITFKPVDEQHIDIMSGDKKIGHIFSPGGTGEAYENAIQVCGFEDAYDLWGCGLFGEEGENKVFYGKEQLAKLREFEKNNEGQWAEHWKEMADKGYHVEKTTAMKKDIQLRFKEYDNVGLDRFSHISCWQCFNKPCTCDGLKLFSSFQFPVKYLLIDARNAKLPPDVTK